MVVKLCNIKLKEVYICILKKYEGMCTGNDVYHIIAYIRKVVDRELLIQKYIGMSTNDLLNNFIIKKHNVLLKWCSNMYHPTLIITPSRYMPLHNTHPEHTYKYFTLHDDGIWHAIFT
jgi:hypothetical protein